MAKTEMLDQMLQVRMSDEDSEIADLIAGFYHHTRSQVTRDLFYEHTKQLAKKYPQFARDLSKIRHKYRRDGR